jgi:hypothetical protein
MLIRFEKRGRGSGNSYTGLRVSTQQICMSNSFQEIVNRPSNVDLSYDPEEMLIAVTPSQDPTAFKVVTLKVNYTGIINARLSKYIPEGRYVFLEKRGEAYVCRYENAKEQ